MTRFAPITGADMAKGNSSLSLPITLLSIPVTLVSVVITWIGNSLLRNLMR